MLTEATLLIGGDVCPIGRNEAALVAGSPTVFGNILPEVENADLTIVNLECPLIVKSTAVVKGGPTLAAKAACVKGLKAGGIDIVNLANNHIMDHGLEGLRSTLSACENAGIATVGAGLREKDARRLLIRTVNNIRIGILGIAESEYSIARNGHAGAYGVDTIDLVHRLRGRKEACDFLVVLLHGGNEHYKFPRPGLLELCRFIIEEGAHVVICQQSHCVGTYEEYMSGLIVYGQGNLIFDLPIEEPGWHEGMLVKLIFSSEQRFEYELIPIFQSCGGEPVKRMDSMQSQTFLYDLAKRSRVLGSKQEVERLWLEFCLAHRNTYMSMALAMGKLLSKLNRNGFVTRLLYRRGNLRTMGNVIRCESHREVLIRIADSDIDEERRQGCHG